MSSTEFNTVAAEAAEWFVDLQSGEVSRERQEAFADWLRRSPVHVEEFLQLSALHADLTHSPEIKQMDLAGLMSILPAQEENIINLPRALPARPTRPKLTSSSLLPIGLAATFLIGVLLSAGPLRALLATERYETRMGEQRSLMLADGSQVQLNVRSNLTARLDDATRDIRLNDGEALFKVAKDATRPFRVRTPQATIQAVGTQFNVHVKNGATIVALLEGRVDVQPSSGSSRVTLHPGEAITVAATDSAPSKPRNADLKTMTAWTEHRLVFEDAPLSEVVAEFNRYSRQPLEIEDHTLHDVRITASFDSGSVQAFADTLASAGGLRVVRRADGTWLIGR